MEKLTDFKFVTEAQPSNIVVVPTFLKGEFGQTVMREYNERVKSGYNNNSKLDIFNFSGDVVTGSNTFAVPIIEDILLEAPELGLHVATLADLERFIKSDSLKLRGQYEDVGVALRSEDSPNEYHAKSLATQIRERSDGKDFDMPVYVNLRDLRTVNDSEAPNGLGLKLRDDAQIIYASILNDSGSFSSKDIDEKTGLPTKTEGGNRTLYIASSGLAQVCLDNNLDLDSGCGGLAYSGSDGRVVVSDAVAPKKTNVQIK